MQCMRKNRMNAAAAGRRLAVHGQPPADSRKSTWRRVVFPIASITLVATLTAGLFARQDDTGVREQRVPPQAAAAMAAAQQRGGGQPQLPSWESVSEGFEEVISTIDGTKPMYNVWKRERDGQVLAELPRNFEQQLLFFAYTVKGGSPFAGVQTGDRYLQWKRFDRRLALIEPNFLVRTTGDLESQKGRDRVFTDRVLLDIPIAAQGPNGQPVINMTDLLLGNASTFFGRMGAGVRRNLLEIETAKAFPRNVELAWQLPLANGQLATLHYSLSVIPNNTGYRPREADLRVGFFTTAYRDIGDPSVETPWKRYINRWHLEKAEPSLKLSPPKEPIVFYIEHTTPIRYRRWVREGVLEWNKAFEKVGISNAIEVRQQDARTGAYMDKDPEDARWNFILWTNAGMGFAIGPSRVDPRTGQILDADVVLDEGFISSWARSWRELIPELAMGSFGPETLAWLDSRPEWDPRVLLAPPEKRADVLNELQQRRAEGMSRGIHRFAGHPAANVTSELLGEHPFEGLHGRPSQRSGLCMNGLVKSLDIAMFRYGADVLAELAEIRYEKRSADDADDPISGTWDGTIEIPEMGSTSLSMELTRAADNSVSGTMSGDGESISVSGSYDPASQKLTLRGDVPNMGPVDFEFTVQGEQMTGFVTMLGQQLPLTFRRVSRPSTAVYVPVEVSDDNGDDEDEERDDDEETTDRKPTREETRRAEVRDSLDGMPESFVGPLLRDLTMHEVGHVLGLRHNFKASSIYSLEQINSPEHMDAGKQIAGSVMEYNAMNINFGDGPVQGHYSMMSIGPYDYWAIEYGYSFERNLDPILKRVSEPELAYATDEDTWGPDPQTQRWDMGDNSLDYANSQMRLVKHLRERIIERIVSEGESWAKVRRAYEMLLWRHFSAVNIAANWIGGSSINRDLKGDPGDRRPIENVSAEQQRAALQFVIDNAFNEEAFGLTRELLHKMTVDKWWDPGGFGQIFSDPTWPVHDRVLGIQSTAMTMVMNPTTLNRVFDNEYRIDAEEDALTLPEVIFGVSDAIWSEINALPSGNYTARQPLISSMRRNLQSEHLKRLIDLSMPNQRMGAAQKAISNLAVHKLRELKGDIDRIVDNRGSRLDPYSLAHLGEARVRIDKALEAQYIYNVDAIGGGGQPTFIILGQDQNDSSIAVDHDSDYDWQR
jgi:hypothetical protein